MNSTTIFRNRNRQRIRAKIRHDACNKNSILVKFTCGWKQYWTGKFMLGENANLTRVLTYGRKPRGFVIASGKGYLVDFENQKARKITNDDECIVSAVVTTDHNYCIAGTMDSLYVIDEDGVTHEIVPDFAVEGFYLDESPGDEVKGKLESDINQYESEISFRIDPRSLRLFVEY